MIPSDFQSETNDEEAPVYLKDTRGRRAGTGKRVRSDVKASIQETGNQEAQLDILMNDLTRNLGVNNSSKPTPPSKPLGIAAMFQKK